MKKKIIFASLAMMVMPGALLAQQLPDFKDYSMKGRTYRYMNDALFPFGYGLSYTSFRIGDATLSNSILKKGEKITLNSSNFELFDAATNTVRAKAGKYEVYYGSSSADKDLKKLDVSIEY